MLTPIKPLALVCFAAAVAVADEVDFARDIRPILSENCSFCHGPDEATRQADLRLDTSTGAWSMIAQGSAADSELFRRITTADADELMPPADSNRSLTRQQIELIGRWIDQGAKWEQHWSLRPIVAPEVPAGKHPIDALVRQALDRQGMSLSPPADKATLIRRLSLDLTGLPPTPQAVETFLSDQAPGSDERLVDRLLASAAYGQRMAWDWLDAARYADTNGYQGDRERSMWPWRDWVVKAFNENMPYDQFTVWQLAGDLLPNPTDEQVLATAFLRNQMINGEGGRIAEENRVEYVMEMTETTGMIWLGLTLNCCRCHDHKYDPISNEEYYRLFAFFNQTPIDGSGGDPRTKPVLSVPDQDQRERLADLAVQLETANAQLADRDQELANERPQWELAEKRRLVDLDPWQPLLIQQATADHASLRPQDDGSVLATGPQSDRDTYIVAGKTMLTRVTAVRLEVLRHESLLNNSLANSASGNFVLTGIEIEQQDPGTNRTATVPINSADATFEQDGHPIDAAFDGDPATGWAVYDGRTVDQNHAAVFRLTEAVPASPEGTFRIVLRHDSRHPKHVIGRFRLSVTDQPEPVLNTDDRQLLMALETPVEQRSDAHRNQIIEAHRDADADYTKTRLRRDNLNRQHTEIENAVPKVMVMGQRDEPRKTYVLTRGLYNQPGKAVTAGLPDCLPAQSVADKPMNRLTLARWLVDSENPLTARVTVNRFWQQFFGVGLVKTTEDFGAQGETPQYAELLDYLASYFRDSGWDVKGLIRLIVTSDVYRQSSKVSNPESHAADPNNRLLARGSRYRMPAWMLRDQALAASGLLSQVAAGPGVNTYQPPGIWEEASFGKKKYDRDSGEKLYRRSLYVFWRRIIAPPMFFDNAKRQVCEVKPNRTNTPLQALQLFNSVTYVEAARVLAEQTLHANLATDDQRIDDVMMRVMARAASSQERTILLNGLTRTKRQYAEGQADHMKLLSVGESPRDTTLDAIEHAAWTNLCLAVLNLDETLTRE